MVAAVAVVWLAWTAGLVSAAPPRVSPARAAVVILRSPAARRADVVSVRCIGLTGAEAATLRQEGGLPGQVQVFGCVVHFGRPIQGHRCFEAPFVVEPRVLFDATLGGWCDAPQRASGAPSA